MPRMNRHVPETLFVLLLATLLVGARFGFPWAGVPSEPLTEAAVLVSDGDVSVDAAGKRRPLGVGQRLRRGEIVLVGPGGYAELSVAGVRMGLDERTDLLLSGLSAVHPSVRLVQGRLVAASGPSSPLLSVTTEATDTQLPRGASMTVINYGFRHVVEIVPYDAPLPVLFGADGAVVAIGAQRVTERPDVSIESFPFDADTSAGAAFYDRFNLSFRK